MKFGLHFLVLLLTVLSLTACSHSKPTEQAEQKQASDPLEGFNRKMFDFNYNLLDPYVLRPVAVAWNNYVPTIARTGISNFLSNLDEPVAMVNSLLRMKPDHAIVHFNRFFLNTLLGLGGFIDVAGKVNPKLIRQAPERFGGTLGHYGVGYGPYVVVPVFGSVTPREQGGNYLDTFYPVLSFLTNWSLLGKSVLEGIETRARLLNSDDILHNSKDPYAFMRSAYYQRSDFLANGGQIQKDSPASRAIEAEIDEIDAEE